MAGGDQSYKQIVVHTNKIVVHSMKYFCYSNAGHVEIINMICKSRWKCMMTQEDLKSSVHSYEPMMSTAAHSQHLHTVVVNKIHSSKCSRKIIVP